MNQSTIYSNLIMMRRGKQRDGLQQLIDELPEGLIMAEIGCYAGESTEMFLQSDKVERLFAIDPYQWWEDVNDPTTKSDLQLAEKVFCERLLQYRRIGQLTKLRQTLFDSLIWLDKVNFIYLDGDHRYESLKFDINLSLKLLKSGNLIAGHNYTDFASVKQAVDEAFGQPDKIYIDSSWIVKLK